MRLFDKICASKPAREQFLDGLDPSEITVLAIDELLSHAAKEWMANDEMTASRFPYCKPPFDYAFTEVGVAAIVEMFGGAIRSFACHTAKLKPTAFVSQYVSGACDEAKDSGDGDVYISTLVASVAPNDHLWEVPLLAVWSVSDCGSLASAKFVDLFHERQSEDELDAWLDLGRLFFEASLLAFTFANCANVKLEDSTEELQPPEKIRRRLKLPCVKRYTLNIEGHSTKPRANGEPGQTGIMPWHLCRGHFATYTEAKPRFGRLKDGVGRFWIPPHVRGREERGRIEKDYAISAEKEPVGMYHSHPVQ